MNKELYVSSNPHETRVALVEDDQLAEIFYERENEYTLAGSIYKGRVTRVLPGMQSAFVDIGLERDAFLYVSDFLDLQDEEDEDFEVAVKTNGAADNTRREGRDRDNREGRDNRDRENRREERQPSRREESRRDEPRQSEPQQPTAVFEGGYSVGDDADEGSVEAETLERGGNGSGAEAEGEEGDEGARRWRGRRRRRGGRRGRTGGEKFERTETQQQAASASEREAEPEQQEPVREERTPSRGREERGGRRDRSERSDRSERGDREFGPPAGYKPIILPGESLSKYRNRPQPSASTVEPPEEQGIHEMAHNRSAEAQEFLAHNERLSETLDHDHPTQPTSGLAETSDEEAEETMAAAIERADPDAEAAEPVQEQRFEAPSHTVEEHEEEPTEGYAELRGSRKVAEMRHEPPVEFEEVEEEEQVEEAEHAEQVSAEAAFTGEAKEQADEAVPQPSKVDREPVLTGTGEGEGDEAFAHFSVEQRTHPQETTQRTLPEIAPEGKTLEHEVFDGGEESVEPMQLAQDDSGESDMELEEETLEASGTPGRWIPHVADIEEDLHDHEVEDFEYSNGNGEGLMTEGEEEEEEGDEEGEDEEGEGEEAVAGGTGTPTRRRFEKGRRGRRGRRGPSRNNMQSRSTPLISDLLKEGQEILVQIAKEPIGKKGARITSHIALPGRFLVYMPTVNHVGVSRKIASDEERQRLKRIVTSERENGHGGFIVRTAASNVKEDELRADIRFLKHLWGEIKARSEKSKSPALIYHDLNLVERVLRDQVTSDFTTIWVDNEQEYERVLRFGSRFQPSLVRRIKLYTKNTPLFEEFNIQEEINKALKAKVWLKSGGYIVINQTEALVAIDINTGKYVGKTTRLEDTIVKTNVDAIKEIVRQIRLRDLGGIIVIDFIDMDERKNRQKVMAALEEALKSDRAPSKVLQFNDFGLVAITRKRVKQSLERTLGTPCAYCDATGFVKSVTTMTSEIYTEMRKLAKHLDGKDVTVRVNPEVAKVLKDNNGKLVQEFEELTGKTVIVKSDAAMHQEHFDIH